MNIVNAQLTVSVTA